MLTKELFQFLGEWSYPFFGGNAIYHLVKYASGNNVEDLQLAKFYLAQSLKHSELGFKNLGPNSIQHLCTQQRIEGDLKTLICDLHRGLHMLRRAQVLEVAQGLDNFIEAATMKTDVKG